MAGRPDGVTLLGSRGDRGDPMATLTVWKFDDPAGADQAEQTLVSLSTTPPP
jgi:hypothetical protein